MKGITDRWRVEVTKPDRTDGWMLSLKKWCEDDGKFYTYTYWFLTPALDVALIHLRLIHPAFWFKPLGERMAIALEWAIDEVKRAEAPHPLAVKEAWLDAQACALFAEALRDMDGQDA